jgi:hypothetical protein
VPWFTYKCKDHGEFRAILEKRTKTHKCPQCTVECYAIYKIGTVQLVERIDNGVMARAVERLHNIDELMDDRNREHKERYGKPDSEDDSEGN